MLAVAPVTESVSVTTSKLMAVSKKRFELASIA